MTWTRNDCFALARVRCTTCHGTGLTSLAEDVPAEDAACSCVWRAVFRACMSHFRICAARHSRFASVSYAPQRSGGPRVTGFKHLEYMADVDLVARRALRQHQVEDAVFRFHFLLGADWKLCCKRLGINRGVFYHTAYALMARAGRALALARPYSVYPIDAYFGITSQALTIKPTETTEPARFAPLRPPLQPKPKRAPRAALTLRNRVPAARLMGKVCRENANPNAR